MRNRFKSPLKLAGEFLYHIMLSCFILCSVKKMDNDILTRIGPIPGCGRRSLIDDFHVSYTCNGLRLLLTVIILKGN